MNILLDWAKDKVQKSLVEAVNRYDKQIEGKQSVSFLGHDSEKKHLITLRRQSSETTLTKKNWCYFKVRNHGFVSNNKPTNENVLYGIKLFRIFNFCQSQKNC